MSVNQYNIKLQNLKLDTSRQTFRDLAVIENDNEGGLMAAMELFLIIEDPTDEKTTALLFQIAALLFFSFVLVKIC